MGFNSVTCVLLFATLSFQVLSDKLYHNTMRQNEYDYIIVGAGSAGSVLANRLSEDPDVHVLLLEAGGEPDGVSDVPYFFSEMVNSDFDWKYYTESQENCCFGLKGKQLFFPRGKVLGGSSTINALMYVRGSPRDYDEWAKGGAKGWSWEEVLPYFKKSEDLRGREHVDEDYHGRGGYLTISVPLYSTPLQQAYLDAGKYLGYNVLDVNGRTNYGFSFVQANVRDGRRCSTEKAFLRPAARRENLDILTGAHVTKIIFDDDKRAHSVRFEWEHATREVRARREIILSAGTIGSPQILMLSGVGPKEHLGKLQIPVIADLPVGENLQDHISNAAMLYLLNSSVTINLASSLTFKNIGDLVLGKGPLASPPGFLVTAFVNTKYQDEAENWPDMQFILGARHFFPKNRHGVEEFEEENLNGEFVHVIPLLARPKGRGYIRLRSTDPFEHPIIQPRFLSESDDLARIVEGMKILDKLMKTPPMKKFGPVRVPKVLTGCEGLDPEGDEYLACLARTITTTGFHPCGTCRMGDTDDPTTVLDPQLRVKGVQGLRVVDASVMPLVTSGNINAPTIMIAEKAADMIRRLSPK